MLDIEDVLLARDFSTASNAALRYALDLARRTDATLHLLYAEVLHESPVAPVAGEPPGAERERIKDRLLEGPEGEPIDTEGIEVQRAVLRDVAAGPAILSYADTRNIDVTVLGTHGRRGVRRMLMGSVAEEVVRRSDRPVLVVHQEEEETPPAMAPPDVSSLLVPVDFSEHAREALRHAAALGALYDASLNLLHVVEDALPSAFYVGGVQSIYDVEPDLDDKAREALQTFVEKAGVPDAVETSVHVASGRAADVIAEQSEALESGMVVMSTHGNTGAENYLLGSVAEKVVRRARCPVFTVRAFGQSILQSAT